MAAAAVTAHQQHIQPDPAGPERTEPDSAQAAATRQPAAQAQSRQGAVRYPKREMISSLYQRNYRLFFFGS